MGFRAGGPEERGFRFVTGGEVQFSAALARMRVPCGMAAQCSTSDSLACLHVRGTGVLLAEAKRDHRPRGHEAAV